MVAKVAEGRGKALLFMEGTPTPTVTWGANAPKPAPGYMTGRPAYLDSPGAKAMDDLNEKVGYGLGKTASAVKRVASSVLTPIKDHFDGSPFSERWQPEAFARRAEQRRQQSEEQKRMAAR